MSELGSSLSGWFKVGAVAMGIGVGMGGVPEGGMCTGVGKVRAGKYGLYVTTDGKRTIVSATDVVTGKRSNLSFAGSGEKVCGLLAPSYCVFDSYGQKKDRIVFSLGSFNFVCFPGGSLHASGGTLEDSLYLGGGRVIIDDTIAPIKADVLVFYNCCAVENYSAIHSRIFSISNCPNFCNRRLVTDLFVFSNVHVRSNSLEAKEILKPEKDVSEIDPFGDNPVVTKKENKVKRLTLEKLSRALGGGFRAGGWLEEFWSVRAKNLLPFSPGDGLSVKQSIDKDEHFYEFPQKGCYYCVFFIVICDGCGQPHGRDVFIEAKDGNGRSLAKSVRYVKEKQLSHFLFVIKLEDNLSVNFHLYNSPEVKCSCAVGTDEAFAYFYPMNEECTNGIN